MRAANEILRALRKNLGTAAAYGGGIPTPDNLGGLVGLHLRIEDDAVGTWGEGATPSSFASSMLQSVFECLKSNAPEVLARPEQFAVYIASGVPVSSPLLEELRKQFPIVTSKEVLALENGGVAVASALNALGGVIDVLAAVDHIVLRHTRFFSGFFNSTFSLQVAQERLRIGRPSALHADPIKRPGEKCWLFTAYDLW